MNKQYELPMYENRGKWSLPEGLMFTALLLECGPPPARDGLIYTYGEHPFVSYYKQVRDAMEKYYRADPHCPIPFDSAHGFKIDAFLRWVDTN